MTRNVIGIRMDATIGKAIELMLQGHVSGLPVFDAENQLVGIVSEGDLLRRAELGTEMHKPRWIEFLLGPGRMAEEYVHSHGRKVEEVMSRNVITTTEMADLGEAIGLMNRHHIKRLPVMFNARVAGILTRADVLRKLAEQLPKDTRQMADHELRTAVLAELDRQKWAPIAWIDVSVADGTVEFRGNITDERQRDALRVVAENVPGVKGIRDHMIWIEPNTGTFLLSPEDQQAADKEQSTA
jgi:CBS domain-containing protein